MTDSFPSGAIPAMAGALNSEPATSLSQYAALLLAKDEQLNARDALLADQAREIAFLRNQLAAKHPGKCGKCGNLYLDGKPNCDCAELQNI